MEIYITTNIYTYEVYQDLIYKPTIYYIIFFNIYYCQKIFYYINVRQNYKNIGIIMHHLYYIYIRFSN